jgi:hypothetical protein
LTTVTILGGVASIGTNSFADCGSLSIYFTGNAPSPNTNAFTGDNDNKVMTYYLPGTTGWSNGIWGYPYGQGPQAVLWNPLILASGANFGVQNDQFGFYITGATNFTVVVEACTNLASPDWVPIQTNTLTNGSFSFSDPQWTDYSSRYYGLGLP